MELQDIFEGGHLVGRMMSYEKIKVKPKLKRFEMSFSGSFICRHAIENLWHWDDEKMLLFKSDARQTIKQQFEPKKVKQWRTFSF